MNSKVKILAIGFILACGFGGYYYNQSPAINVGKEKIVKKIMTPEERKQKEFILEMTQLNLYKETLKANHPGVHAIAQTIPFSYQLLSYMVESAAHENWKHDPDYLRERFIATIKVAFIHGTNNTANLTPLKDEEIITLAEIAMLLYKENPKGIFFVPYSDYQPS